MADIKFVTKFLLEMKHDKNIQNYTCTICNYTSPFKYSLTRHMKIHDDSQNFPHSCNQCNYRTHQKHHLVRHQQYHISKQLKNITNTKLNSKL